MPERSLVALTALVCCACAIATGCSRAPDTPRDRTESRPPSSLPARHGKIDFSMLLGREMESGSAPDAPAGGEAAGPVRAGEVVLRFGSLDALDAFAERARRAGFRVLGTSRVLKALRLGGVEAGGFAEFVAGLAPEIRPGDAGLNPIVAVPRIPASRDLDGGGSYEPFQNRANGWLGLPVEGGVVRAGQGVLVAVLDGGVLDIDALRGVSIQRLDLVGGWDGAAPDANGPLHASAVAGIVAGQDPVMPGVAPGASLLSVRVLDADGTGDAFTVADGIVQAVDRGAKVINLSLGSFSDSAILREAVDYALSRGVALVAAVGNESARQVTYPARYDGVVAVTAVDASRQLMSFANAGAEVDLAAPGYGVTVPAGSGKVFSFSGTSAAAPFVAGAIAAIVSMAPHLTPVQAADLLVRYADDAGRAGADPVFGSGILNVGRVLERNTPGIIDAAVAAQYLTVENGAAELHIVVQNRGTAPLSGVQVTSDVGGRRSVKPVLQLGVGQSAEQVFPVGADVLRQAGDRLQAGAAVSVPTGADTVPTNDTLTGALPLTPAGSHQRLESRPANKLD